MNKNSGEKIFENFLFCFQMVFFDLLWVHFMHVFLGIGTIVEKVFGPFRQWPLIWFLKVSRSDSKVWKNNLTVQFSKYRIYSIWILKIRIKNFVFWETSLSSCRFRTGCSVTNVYIHTANNNANPPPPDGVTRLALYVIFYEILFR